MKRTISKILFAIGVLLWTVFVLLSFLVDGKTAYSATVYFIEEIKKKVLDEWKKRDSI